MDREAKLLLAAQKLKQFQKKKRKSKASINEDGSQESLAQPDEAPPAAQELPLDSNRNSLLHPTISQTELNASNDSIMPAKSQEQLDEKDKALTIHLERVEYLERLNGMMTKENKTLTARIKELESQVQLISNEYDALQRQQQTSEQLKSKLLKSEDAVKRLNEELERMRVEMAKKTDFEMLLKTKELEHEQQVKDYQKVIETLRSRLFDFEHAQTSAQTSKARQEQLEAQLKQTSDKLEDFKKELKKVLEENEKLRLASEEAKIDFDEEKKTREAAVNSIEELKMQLREKESRVAQLEQVSKQSGATKELETRLRQQLDDALKQLQVSKENEDKVKLKMAEQARELSDARRSEQQVKDDLQTKQDELAALSSEKEQLKREYEEKFQFLAGELDEKARLLNDALGSAGEKGAHLESLSAELAKAKEVQLELEKKIGEVSQDLDDARTSEGFYQSQIDQLNDQLKQVNKANESELKRIQQQLKQTEQQNDKLKQTSDEDLREKDDLQQQLSDAQYSKDDLARQINALKQELQEALNNVSSKQQFITKLEADLSKANSQNSDLVQIIDDLKSDATEKESQIEGLAILKNDIQDLRSQIDQKNQSLEASHIELKDMRQRLSEVSEQNVDLLRVIDKLKADLSEHQEKLQLNDCESRQLAEELELLMSLLGEDFGSIEFRANFSSLTPLVGRLRVYQEQFNQSKQQADEFKRVVDRLQQNGEQLQRDLANENIARQELEMRKNELENEVSLLKEQLKASKDTLIDINARFKKMEEQLADEKDSKKQYMEKIMKNYSKEKEAQDSQLFMLEQMLNDEKDLNKRLGETCQKLEEDLKDLKKFKIQIVQEIMSLLKRLNVEFSVEEDIFILISRIDLTSLSTTQVSSSQIEEYEKSLKHAERTINLLNDEIKRKQEIIEKLEDDAREQLIEQASVHRDELESPTLERHLSTVFSKTEQTVGVIDELLRRANEPQEPADVHRVKLLLHEIDKSLRRLEHPEVARILVLVTEVVKLINYIDLNDGAYSAQLKQTILNMTKIDADSDDPTVALLQSHLRQLRKVWEHETNANHELRTLLSELREKSCVVEEELLRRNSELEKELNERRTFKSSYNDPMPRSFLDGDGSEIQSLRKQLEEANLKLKQVKKTVLSEMESYRNRFREEKQELLTRFKRKLSEVEEEKAQLLVTIQKLKKSGGGASTAERRAAQLDITALQAEVYKLRQEQHQLTLSLRHSHGDDNERSKHQEHCRYLVTENSALRLRLRREAGYRADLIYQKKYLMMLTVPQELNVRPKKGMRVFQVVLFISRLRVLVPKSKEPTQQELLSAENRKLLKQLEASSASRFK